MSLNPEICLTHMAARGMQRYKGKGMTSSLGISFGTADPL